MLQCNPYEQHCLQSRVSETFSALSLCRKRNLMLWSLLLLFCPRLLLIFAFTALESDGSSSDSDGSYFLTTLLTLYLFIFFWKKEVVLVESSAVANLVAVVCRKHRWHRDIAATDFRITAAPPRSLLNGTRGVSKRQICLRLSGCEPVMNVRSCSPTRALWNQQS